MSMFGRLPRFTFTALLGGGLGAVCVAPRVHAQGFGLNEIGACAVARGFAVTGAPCADGSAIYWNPAATVQLTGDNTLSLGAAVINVSGGFRQDTTRIRYEADLHPEVAPSGFYNYSLNRKAALGIGVYVPYGLTSQWHPDFPGRFSALKASLQSIYIQPNLAYAITPNWSIGGGPVFGTSNVELVQSVDLSTQGVPTRTFTFGQLGIAPGTEFARARVKGDATGWGFNLGLFGKFNNGWSVGARYLSAVKFDYDNADARFDQISTGLVLGATNAFGLPAGTPIDSVVAPQFRTGGALTSQKAKTTITHPWQAEFGAGYSGFAGTTISASIARLGWSKFNTLPISFAGLASASSRTLIEAYDDSWTYRIGAEHTIQDVTSLFSGVTFRAGFSYAESPAPDVSVTPLLPDMPRKNGSIGVGLPLGLSTQLDASYLYVGTSGRRGRIAERVAGTASADATAAQLNTGAYDLKANVFSVSLTTHF